MATVDPYVAQLAKMASGICGLDPNVILAQWQIEEGVGSPNWPVNNPAGLRPVVYMTLTNGDAAEKFATGVNSSNFLVFPTPMAGAQAYAVRINTDSNYAGVRAAIKTGSPLAELSAIVQSPWDARHYGGDGHTLFNSYAAITGAKVTVPTGLTFDLSTQYATDTSQPTIANQQVFPQTDFSVVANSQRTGNVLYGRRYRVLVSNSNGVALDVSDLQCTFDVQYIMTQPTALSTIEIYNLNPATESFLLNYGDRVVVEAGYEGNQYGVIFEGEIFEPVRDKPDNVTFRLSITAIAGNSIANLGFVNFTAVRGQTARTQVQNLASNASVPSPIGDISGQLSTTKLPRGKAYFGMTRDYLRQIALSNNAAANMHDGRINILHMADPPKGDIIDLAPQTGLIGQPAQNGQGVSFECLLNPSIKIGSMVHIDNQLIQAQTYQIGEAPLPLDSAGIYRVVSVNHVGDTRGDDWTTKCVTVSQAGLLPSMMSGLGVNPY